MRWPHPHEAALKELRFIGPEGRMIEDLPRHCGRTKVGVVESGIYNNKQQVWVHSRALWLLMDFLEQEARRDLELHKGVMPNG